MIHESYTWPVIPTASKAVPRQSLAVTVASAQSAARHILFLGLIGLGILLILYLLTAFLLGLASEGRSWRRAWGAILFVVGGLAGLGAIFGLVLLIALAIGASIFVALVSAGVVTFIGLLMGVSVLALAAS
jgi:hypothetical protein